MFAYNENKQAYIANPDAGTYAQLVEAAVGERDEHLVLDTDGNLTRPKLKGEPAPFSAVRSGLLHARAPHRIAVRMPWEELLKKLLGILF
mgnify:CR=1 FL=1